MVGAAQCQSHEICKLQKKRGMQRHFPLHGLRGVDLGFSPVMYHSATEHLGNGQISYETGHLATLVTFPDDSS